jgi:hypothetical protein
MSTLSAVIRDIDHVESRFGFLHVDCFRNGRHRSTQVLAQPQTIRCPNTTGATCRGWSLPSRRDLG